MKPFSINRRTLAGALLFMFAISIAIVLYRTSSNANKLINQWVTIPAGTFTTDNEDESKPLYIATFKIMAHELTWQQYQPCINAGVCPDNAEAGGDEGWGKGDRPVINVSYDDIITHYIPWLENNTGVKTRLPTELEWAYAARADTTTRYNWGDDISCSQARYGYRSGECNESDSTTVVMTYAANDFGLYDMHGNVWEWVSDCWSGTHQGAALNAELAAQVSTSQVPDICEQRAIRGGSWNAPSGFVHSASRFAAMANFRLHNIGFRLVLAE